MSLSPQVCKRNYKVHVPAMGEECEFWLVRVTDEGSITNPDKDHAYYTDDGKLFIYDGKNLVRVNCDLCFTQDERDKLEGIQEGANNYTLPEADTNVLGGVKLGYTQNDRNYPVLKDENGNIYVAVPWTEFNLQTAGPDTLGGIKTGYQEQGKNYAVTVDVDGNAYVTVPWSDTVDTYEVVSQDVNGLAPMLPSEDGETKFLRGDATWATPQGASYEVVDKENDGLCPKLPNETTTTKYLRQDGQWVVPPNTTYGNATTGASGLMSATDKSRLDQLWAKFDSAVFFTNS